MIVASFCIIVAPFVLGANILLRLKRLSNGWFRSSSFVGKFSVCAVFLGAFVTLLDVAALGPHKILKAGQIPATLLGFVTDRQMAPSESKWSGIQPPLEFQPPNSVTQTRHFYRMCTASTWRFRATRSAQQIASVAPDCVVG
jgi:hypothetical protein